MDKINDFYLLAPVPYYLDGVGYLKNYKLIEIASEKHGYEKYLNNLSMLSLNKTQLISLFKIEDIYNSFSNEQKSLLTVFDLIVFMNLGEFFKEVLSFFICGNIQYQSDTGIYIIDECGKIDRENYELFKSSVLQLNNRDIKEDELNEDDYESEEAKEAIKAFRKGREEVAKKSTSDYSFSNLISSLIKSHPNVWNYTVCQLFDAFQRDRNNYYYDFIKMNYAFNGKDIDSTQWYKSLK